MEWTKVSKRSPTINKQLLVIFSGNTTPTFVRALKPCEKKSTKFHPGYIVWQISYSPDNKETKIFGEDWVEIQDNDLWIELPELPKK